MLERSQERQLAMWSHLSAAICTALSIGILGWAVPLVMLLMKGGESRLVKFHALQSLLAQGLIFISTIVLLIAGIFTCGVGWVLLVVLVYGSVVYQIIAGLKANEGEMYALPLVGDIAKRG